MTPQKSLKDKLSEGERDRLVGLLKTAQAELQHLQQTDQRLFGMPFSPEVLVAQLQHIDFSERVDAFVARFGRLQDLLGDKLLPGLFYPRPTGSLKPVTPPSLNHCKVCMPKPGWALTRDCRHKAP